MSLTIIERLRCQPDAWNGLCLQAADEIERLESALAEVQSQRISAAVDGSQWKVRANRLASQCRELDEELDGVKLPATAEAICNGIRATLDTFEEE